MQTDVLLTPAEVADRLRVSTATLERWRRNGTGPAFVKAGPGLRGRVGYRPNDIEAFIAGRTVHSTAEAREMTGW
jgi:predicted site-specific integrase-resolvase